MIVHLVPGSKQGAQQAVRLTFLVIVFPFSKACTTPEDGGHLTPSSCSTLVSGSLLLVRPSLPASRGRLPGPDSAETPVLMTDLPTVRSSSPPDFKSCELTSLVFSTVDRRVSIASSRTRRPSLSPWTPSCATSQSSTSRPARRSTLSPSSDTRLVDGLCA